MSQDDSFSEAIAVIGMAGRFPGADNIDQLWRNVLAGTNSISLFSPEELQEEGIPLEQSSQPGYVAARGVVADADLFDADFFGLSPREAEVMDPQNRLFLECCWQACEDAGYDIRAFDQRAGVYGGANLSTYLLFNLLSRPDLVSKVGDLQVRISNDKDSLTTWVAYKLNLKGPCVTVQTACSTSLVAVHFACQGLLDGECDLALAGGVGLSFPLRSGYMFQEGSILSSDGLCRPFDAAAEGTVTGTGVGVVALKRLSDAVEDGDPIRAVIRGTAINNDGASKAGYTAPGVEGQMRVIAEALALAEVPARTIGYVETHGSGTRLGDPIEIEALTGAFRRHTEDVEFCALGSAKANIGHLDSAAGIAGLIKAVCAVESGRVPPMANFEAANPALGLPRSPFYVPMQEQPWQTEPGVPRRAGVSSFGIGGTNVHAVLEQAPESRPTGSSRPWQQLLFSARSAAALDAASEQLAAHLEASTGEGVEDLPLADVAYTLKVGRRSYAHRRALVCRDKADAVAVLRGAHPRRLLSGRLPTSGNAGGRSGVVFLFPGLGDHYPGMGLELYEQEPVFRQAVDRCAEILRPHLGEDPRQVLFPPDLQDGSNLSSTMGTTTGESTLGESTPGPDLRRLLGRSEAPRDAAEQRLDATRLAHPIVFMVEYAMAQLLMSWGIRPRAMVGYSLGEYVAACLSGVFSLEQALLLVVDRARMIDDLPPGAMLAIPLPEQEVLPWLESAESATPQLWLSAVNGDSLSVVGGSSEAVQELMERLATDGVVCRELHTTHAFHTPMMDPIRDPLARRLAQVKLQEPEIPFVSNVTGTWIRPDEAQDPTYWSRHLAQTVRFTEGLMNVLEMGGGDATRLEAAGDADKNLLLLEVGPGQGLTTLARQQIPRHAVAEILATMPDRRDKGSRQAYLLNAMTRLWLQGVEIDWQEFYRHEQRRRVALPTYPFERKRFWVEPGAITGNSAASTAAASTVATKPEGKKADLADWVYTVGWQRTPPLGLLRNETQEETSGPWLLLIDGPGIPEHDFGCRLAERLRQTGGKVVTAAMGSAFSATEDGYTLDPALREHYSQLLAELDSQDLLPQQVVHLWSLPPGPGTEDLDGMNDGSDEFLTRGFYSLLYLAQAWGERTSATVEIMVVSSQLHEVVGGESLCPSKAALLGPCQVIPQEYAQMTCRSVDLEVLALDNRTDVEQRRVDALVAEMVKGDGTPVVAYRGHQRSYYRWQRELQPMPLAAVPNPEPQIVHGGVYLITGGTSETGLAMAEHLASKAAVKLLLLAPPDFPSRDLWQAGADDAGGRLRRLEEASGGVLVVRGAFLQASAVAGAVQQGVKLFGTAPRGVVHTAAVPGAGLVQLKTHAAAEEVLAPKVAGTLALARALRSYPLDFFVLHSASAVFVGGVGQVDSCAANAFLDAFAQDHRAVTGSPTIAMAWDSFRWESHDTPGQSNLPEEVFSQLQENLQLYGIEADEHGELFDRLLNTRLSHAVLSGRRFRQVVEEFEALKSTDVLSRLTPGHDHGGAGAHRRPDLDTAYIRPETPTEKTLAGLWQDAFGMDRIGVDDNFFDLEGNSLMAVQIVTRLRGHLGVELPMGVLFEAPTVAELAARIDALQQAETAMGEDEMEAMLAEIEGLSAEEAEQLLAKEEQVS